MWGDKNKNQDLNAGDSGGTDQEKLLTSLVTELQESQRLVRFQQRLLQDGLISPPPSELGDCYFLEEWERLQMRRSEFDRQRRTFESERQSFTDAAVRLGREVKTAKRECSNAGVDRCSGRSVTALWSPGLRMKLKSQTMFSAFHLFHEGKRFSLIYCRGDASKFCHGGSFYTQQPDLSPNTLTC